MEYFVQKKTGFRVKLSIVINDNIIPWILQHHNRVEKGEWFDLNGNK